MKNALLLLGSLILVIPAHAYSNCSSEETILNLERRNATAFAEQSSSDLIELLHPNFTWVHDHANMVHRSRLELLEFLEGAWEQSSPSNAPNVQRDIEILINNDVAIIYGFNDVTRGTQQITYHFMKTYVTAGEECVMLSNHTMEVPKDQ